VNVKKLVCVGALLAGTVCVAGAQDIDALLADIDRDLVGELMRTGSVEQYIEDRSEIALTPAHPLAEYILDSVDDVRPNVISEQLVLVDVTADRTDILELYNSLRRVSDLSYLEYRNERTDRTHDLFRESSAIDDPRRRRAIDDPVVRSIPDDDRVWVLQGLPPFGEIVSEYRYRSDGRAFLFAGTNHDALPYRGFRVVKPGNMITYILVIPTDRYVLMYGLGGVRAFTIFGLLDDRIEAAFSGRTDGIFSWYYSTYLASID
jgi:hypothetical protein